MKLSDIKEMGVYDICVFLKKARWEEPRLTEALEIAERKCETSEEFLEVGRA